MRNLLLRGLKSFSNRRSFMTAGLTAGAASITAGLLAKATSAYAQEGPEESSGSLTKGDAAILRFLAAAKSWKLIYGNSTTN